MGTAQQPNDLQQEHQDDLELLLQDVAQELRGRQQQPQLQQRPKRRAVCQLPALNPNHTQQPNVEQGNRRNQEAGNQQEQDYV